MAGEGDENYLTTAEVARRLQVKPATVYAYVSRGMLTSVRARGRRGSLFAAAEVERLAGRSVEHAGVVERIESQLTLLQDDELYYRGHPARRLATTNTVEEVAHLLWTGEPPNQAAPEGAGAMGQGPQPSAGALGAPGLHAPTGAHGAGGVRVFGGDRGRVGLARGGMEVVADGRLTDLLRVGVAVLGAADPLRFDLSTGSVTGAAGQLIGNLIAALPGPIAINTTLGGRLWPKLANNPPSRTTHPNTVAGTHPNTAASADAPRPEVLDAPRPEVLDAPRPEVLDAPRPEVLDAALILLADHGLAVSTIAARVAASARANLYAVISAGLGALDGQYHGAAPTLAYEFLRRARQDPLKALSDQLRSGEPIPGFGHKIYQQRDPRAEVLLGMLGDHPIMETVTAIADRTTSFPNSDLAIAAITHAYNFRPDAGEALFALARMIGWTAHALEEYAAPALRFRALGVYTGPTSPQA
ncbi:citrate/2-methylcitrate synthase [Kribbella solani]|uniref:citrate synthase (unknown stereospecificity) n=1 Tax=Kribbella solani TaxID=236067 RepID=A0A841DK97_9ACTN|nr:citrate/2-methylcitrate synthase [Kribbella solani]MBB5976877.1 citrate synthase [Kribbella solani]